MTTQRSAAIRSYWQDSRADRYCRALHPVGIFFALVFFALSMTPSLLPRAWYLQAVATGISVAIGYGVGCLIAWVVRICGVSPDWSEQWRRRGWWALAVAAVVVIPLFLILGSWWQQIVRKLVGVEDPGRPLYIAVLVVSLVVAVGVLALGRLLRRATRALTRWGKQYVPRPVARIASVIVVALLVVFAVNGALIRGIVAVAERSASTADRGNHEGVEKPTAAELSGSDASNEEWDSLGQEGRRFVVSGVSPDEISEFTGRPAVQPIRAYAGVESADTVEGVAQRVVAELDRTGAFSRAVLGVATTTGRGWVNENVARPLEYLYDGNSAIASMQYSFLPSPMAFLADRQTPQDAGRALFEAVYEVWSELPEDSRPKLVLFGESLGAYGGQDAFSGAQDMIARIDGALWVGNPNFTPQWARITGGRDAGSREILPVIDGGEHVRFASSSGDLDIGGQWEEPRIVYWQHASDPIVWWSPDLILNRPDWLREPRGADVDPGVQWFPFVTFWQLTFDQVFSTNVDDGHGHSYGADAVNMWADILEPANWSESDVERLYEKMAG
ncbi:alpha/beta hydrolase [Rhodococcus sp. IEGM 1401]|uniref:alpha/beta hydrolase n=1 Tax=unclassified Rhodococcus (in: high G+C Gram-positive bacteria) TaxID=192944 RepID=UPI0022B586A8|nr:MULTISPECIES: alpha/beta hydrolase [unclassified Rhodococcus (in: high G+C Gram-positive bacteria)]MCZ4562633.1 alpha/beta hydrolase [Rhodococcus sp. IEGM 1401]MDI9922675.1 alpha/beta hydrolase [Rhodococcus sp. IEGM 1372]MDV8035164.1 alpha/beta hydrolase [Rhodococcus sp. IEGM 1414]